MNPDNDSDSLAELLGMAEFPPLDSAQRDAIFAQTRPVLRRRRWGRRGAWSVAFMACFALGVFSGARWNQSKVIKELAARATTGVSNPDIVVEPRHLPDSTSSRESVPHEEPHQDRSPPVQSPDVPSDGIAKTPRAKAGISRFEILRQAGDRQLNERGNLQAALGCYRRALDCASDSELRISPERDSWLLIPLKEARLEAGKHVQKKG